MELYFLPNQINDSELNRLEFLLSRGGVLDALDFYSRARLMYKEAAKQALKPIQRDEVKMVARGKEWAKSYSISAYECQFLYEMLGGV